MMNAGNILGKNIQFLREQAKKTQKELAAAVGVHVQTVSDWERGMRYPGHPKRLKLAEYFNVTESDLFSPDINKYVPPPQSAAEEAGTEAPVPDASDTEETDSEEAVVTITHEEMDLLRDMRTLALQDPGKLEYIKRQIYELLDLEEESDQTLS